MPDFTQYTCPVCGREITPSDDIVVCPQCGAPHHRDCWKKEGHCHFQPDHGTPSQWKPLPERADEGAVVCGNCGSANAAGQTCCRKCGRELNASVSEEEEEPPSPCPPPFSLSSLNRFRRRRIQSEDWIQRISTPLLEKRPLTIS